MTTIITSIFGSYDHPKAFEPQSIPCRMLMVSDQSQHPSCRWEVMIDPREPERSPRFMAKRPKLFPWDYSEDGPWIWIDASMEIISPTFAEEALDGVKEIAMWRHPARDDLYAEAEFSTTLPKYAGEPLVEQANHYLEDGVPRHWGLWAAGCIVYRYPMPRLAVAWQHEIWLWGIQDQVSLPYAAFHTGDIPEDLPHHLLDNPWLRLHFHHDGTS
jgi:hypothetical protein